MQGLRTNGIRCKKVGVINPSGDDFLTMLLDIRIVADLQTIGYVSDTKLIMNYAFAVIFENTFATKDRRETGIHKHIKAIEFDDSNIVEMSGEQAMPVRAYLSVPISSYERMRSTLTRHGETNKPEALQVLKLG